jgi:Mg2+ and Co2+ transporter CorA
MLTETAETQTELRAALGEFQEVEALVHKAENTPESQLASAPTVAEAEQFRERAKRQRERGIRNLERRHDGVLSMMESVELNERVVASSFQRYYSTIEAGLNAITRRGPLILGVEATRIVLQEIDQRIATLLEGSEKEFNAINVDLEMASQSTDWMAPGYTNPAASHEIQIRTPRAKKVIGIFKFKDKTITAMQQLVWNGHMEVSAVERAELQLKTEIRELYNAIVRAMRGLSNQGQRALEDKTAA